MTRKEIIKKLEIIGCDETTYENIKYYLKANNWKLKDVTDIQKSETKGYCRLFVEGIEVGVI